METSPDGTTLAFLTDSISERQELMDAYGIYLVDTGGGGQAPQIAATSGGARQHPLGAGLPPIFFSFLNGSVEGEYQDAQPRVYWVDANSSSRAAHALGQFPGRGHRLCRDAEGGLLITGRTGTEVQVYREEPHIFVKQPGAARHI